jgi:hypothetical protein
LEFQSYTVNAGRIGAGRNQYFTKPRKPVILVRLTLNGHGQRGFVICKHLCIFGLVDDRWYTPVFIGIQTTAGGKHDAAAHEKHTDGEMR